MPFLIYQEGRIELFGNALLYEAGRAFRQSQEEELASMLSSREKEKKEVPLSWIDRAQYFEEMKNPLLREKAAEKYVKTFQSQIEYIARKSSWGNQWGYEDAYQHAVTFVLEKAYEANDPSELPRRLDICNAIKEEAAQQIYSISLSPYLIKKHGYGNHSFDHEGIVSDETAEPQIFDELTWRRIERLAESYLDAKDLKILRMLMETPGRIPSIEEIAESLSLKLDTAKRYVRHTRQMLREIPELLSMYEESIGIDVVPVMEEGSVFVASEKVISLPQWRRTKIGWKSNGKNNSSLCLNRVQKVLTPHEKVNYFHRLSVTHLTVMRDKPQRKTLLIGGLNKASQVTELRILESLESLSVIELRGPPWNDWRLDQGNEAA